MFHFMHLCMIILSMAEMNKHFFHVVRDIKHNIETILENNSNDPDILISKKLKTICNIIRSAFTWKVIQNNWARQKVGICPLSIVTSYILCLSKSGDSSKQTTTVHIYERLRPADTFTTLMSDWLILHNNYCLFQLIHFLCLRG